MIERIRNALFARSLKESQQELERLAELNAARTESATIILNDDPTVPQLLQFIRDSAELQDYHTSPVIMDAYCVALDLVERGGHMSEDALYAFRLMHEEKGERMRQIDKLMARLR